jgi:hypothetical protein
VEREIARLDDLVLAKHELRLGCYEAREHRTELGVAAGWGVGLADHDRARLVRGHHGVDVAAAERAVHGLERINDALGDRCARLSEIVASSSLSRP